MANTQRRPLWKRIITSAYFWIGVIALLWEFGGDIREWFNSVTTTPAEQFKADNYIEGISVPVRILEDSSFLYFISAGMRNDVPISQIKNGQPFKLNLVITDDSTAFNLYLKLINNKLYFATQLYDLNGTYIGNLNYENGEVRKNQVSYYPLQGTNYLEIRDNENDIMFQMLYSFPNTLFFSGYYLTHKTINTLTNQVSVFPRDQEGIISAETELKKIKSIAAN